MTDPEEAMLGALLHGADPTEVVAQVDPADLYQPTNEWIYQAIIRVHESGQRVDPVKVRFALGEQQGRLPGGPTRLTDLMAACPLPSSVGWYATQVATAAQRRKVHDAGQALLQISETDDPEEMVNEARKRLDETLVVRKAQTVSLASAMAGVVEAAERGAQRGIPSPWPDIDRLTRGFFPGRLYVVGARPGHGKSLFGSCLMTHTARQGLGVLFASIEMPQDELARRAAAADSRIPFSRLEAGGLDEAEWRRLSDAYGRLSQLPVEIADSETQTVAYVRACARTLARKHRLGMIVVDYLQLLQPADKRAPREQQVAEMSRSLKRLAREMDAPVIALAQVNRGAAATENSRPTLVHLRESGAIEADADCVILLHADEETAEVEAHVAKSRSGAKGYATLRMEGYLSRLVSTTREAS